MKKQKNILVLNSGSTSLKFKIFDFSENLISQGQIEKIGSSNSILDFKEFKKNKNIKNHEQGLKEIRKIISDQKINFVVHRFVHGGSEFTKATKLNSKTIKKLKKYNSWAPLHNPFNLKTASCSLKIWTEIPQYAVFDTMFFQNLPFVAQTYAINKKYIQKYKIRKYGFHGFSHENMLFQSAQKLKKSPSKCNLITCHLGGGISVSAIKNGQAIETSMGFGPLSGPMMISRSGSIDPSLIFYLLNQKIPLSELEKSLNFESGIKGLSDFSDLRDLLIKAGYKIPHYSSNKKNTLSSSSAKKILEIFIYQIQRYISSYAGLFDQLDAIILSGTIGERNSDIQKLIFRNLYLHKKFKKIIIPTNEELMMIRKIK